MKKLVMLMMGMLVSGLVASDTVKTVKSGNPDSDVIHDRCLVLKKTFSDGSSISVKDRALIFEINGYVEKTVTALEGVFKYDRTITNDKNTIIDIYVDYEDNSKGGHRMLLLPRMSMKDIPVTAAVIIYDKGKQSVIEIGCMDVENSGNQK